MIGSFSLSAYVSRLEYGSSSPPQFLSWRRLILQCELRIFSSASSSDLPSATAVTWVNIFNVNHNNFHSAFRLQSILQNWFFFSERNINISNFQNVKNAPWNFKSKCLTWYVYIYIYIYIYIYMFIYISLSLPIDI